MLGVGRMAAVLIGAGRHERSLIILNDSRFRALGVSGTGRRDFIRSCHSGPGWRRAMAQWLLSVGHLGEKGAAGSDIDE
jgi:hypothetical protein